MPDPSWDDFTPVQTAEPDQGPVQWEDFQPAPTPVDPAQVKPNAYEQWQLARLGGTNERQGIFGPESPEEAARIIQPPLELAQTAFSKAQQVAEKAGHPVASVLHGLTIPFRLAAGQTMTEAIASGPKEGEPVIPEIMPRPEEKGIIPEVRRFAGGMTTGGSLITLPFLPESQAVRAGFLGQSLIQIPEAIREAGDAKTPAEFRGALTKGLINAGFSGLLAKQIARGQRAGLAPIERTVPDASGQQEAATVHGDLRPQPGESQGEMPLKEGGPGVQPRTAGVAEETPVSLAPEEQAYIDAEREGLGDIKVDVSPTLPDDQPFAGQIATIDRKNNRIVINPAEFGGWLKSIPEGRRQLAVRSLLGEERIHLATDDASAQQYWDNLSGAEKAINRRRYVGTWAGDRLSNGQPVQISDLNLGHEALRFRIQQLSRMAPREIAEAVGRERWTLQGITALETAIRTLRETLGTKASGIQKAILERMQDNLSAAKMAANVSASNPAALKKPVELEDEKGNRIPGIFHGYWDMREVGGELTPSVSRQLANGNWTTGMLRKGEKIVGDVPSFEEWKASEAELNPKPGMVRLYHGEGGPVGAGASEAWWTSSPDYASNFGGKVKYVDVPEAVAEKARAEARAQGTGGPHFVLPDEWVKQGREMQNPPGQRVHDLGPAALRKRGDKLSNAPGDDSEIDTPEKFRGAILQAAQNDERARQYLPLLERYLGQKIKNRPRSPDEQLAYELAVEISAKQLGIPITAPGELSDGPAALRKRGKGEPGQEELVLPPMQAGEARETPPEAEATPPTATALESEATRHFDENTRPSFNKFAEEVGGKFGGVKKAQLRDLWQSSTWNNLQRLSGKQLERIRDSMGLGTKLGTREITDPLQPRPSFQLEPEFEAGSRAEAQYKREAAVPDRAAQNYRNHVIARIGEKLIGESETGRKAWNRTSVGPEDLGHWRETTEGAFRDIRGDELKDVGALGRTLTEAGGVERSTQRKTVSGGEKLVSKLKAVPESVTKRVTALVDKVTGKVHLVSTYRHSRAGAMLVDPLLSNLKRPNRPISDLLERYRPIASALLDEPVKDFHQVFKDVRTFENEFAGPARQEAAQQASYEAKYGEPEDVAQTAKTRLEAHLPGPMVPDEAHGIIEQLWDEVGKVDTEQDVRDAFTGLQDAYQNHRLTDRDWDAIAGYSKAFDVLQKKFPDLSPDEVVDQLVKDVYEKASKADSQEQFAQDFLDTYSGEYGRNLQRLSDRQSAATRPTRPTAEPGQPSPTARELTTLRSKAPTFDPNVKLPKGHGPVPRLPEPVPPSKLSPEALDHVQKLIAEESPYQPTAEPTPWEAPDDLPEAPGQSPAALRKRAKAAQDFWKRTVDALTASAARRAVRRELPAILSGQLNSGQQYATEAGNSIRFASGDVKKPTAWEYLTSPLQAIAEGKVNRLNRLAKADEAEMRRSAVHVFIATGKRNSRGAWYPDKNMIQQFRSNIRVARMQADQAKQFGNLFQKRVAQPWLDYIDDLEKTLNYAEAHWRDKAMWQTVKSFRQEMKDELDFENTNGFNVTDRDNYFPHRYEGDFWHDNGINFGKGPKLLGSLFRKKKTYQNLFEAAANGPYIAASMDAADIAAHRIGQGRKQIAGRMFLDVLKAYNDPDSLQSIGKEPIELFTTKQVTDPKTGIQFDVNMPNGWKTPDLDYELYYPGTGVNVKPMAIRNSYRPLVETLLTPSKIDQLPMAAEAKFVVGALKHGVILIWDTFHPGRVTQYGLSTLGISKLGSKGGYTALNFREAEIPKAVAAGYIPKSSADWALEKVTVNTGRGMTTTLSRKALADMLVSQGLNATKMVDALYKDTLQHIPVIGEGLHKLVGPYNKWLFDRFMPGLMMETAVRNFEKYNAANPDIPVSRLMRDVIRDTNIRFGNLGQQGIFRSKTFQDAAQILLLAPMWQEGLVRSELAAFSRVSGLSYLSGRKGLPYLGVLGSSVMKGLGVYFALTQVANLITRGQPTWKNEEKGHQWDAWIPIGKNGIWLSPMAVYAEITHDLVRLNEDKPTFHKGVMQAVANRLGPVGKAGLILTTGMSPTGEEYTTTAGVLKGAASELFPSPIALGTSGRWALNQMFPNRVSPNQPGALERQAVASTTGTKVQAAKSPLQEENRKVRDWMLQNNLQPQSISMHPTDEASYAKLRNALRNDDVPETLKVLEQLRQTHKEKDIINAMRTWAKRPLTGSLSHERLYLYQLSEPEMQMYQEAIQQKQLEYNQFVDFLMTHQ